MQTNIRLFMQIEEKKSKESKKWPNWGFWQQKKKKKNNCELQPSSFALHIYLDVWNAKYLSLCFLCPLDEKKLVSDVVTANGELIHQVFLASNFSFFCFFWHFICLFKWEKSIATRTIVSIETILYSFAVYRKSPFQLSLSSLCCFFVNCNFQFVFALHHVLSQAMVLLIFGTPVNISLGESRKKCETVMVSASNM